MGMHIIRKEYYAVLERDARLEENLMMDTRLVEQGIRNGKCLTVALYRHENMIFLYYEALEDTLVPEDLFPNVSAQLQSWPQKDDKLNSNMHWKYMYPIFYHTQPHSLEDWERTGTKMRRGRIAYLQEDKIFSYVYHHYALVQEGLLEGDRYQFISLHENLLFSYFEEPKQMTHIRQELEEPSTKIEEWLAVNPEKHFDHNLSGKENFLMLPELFSMGIEDLK